MRRGLCLKWPGSDEKTAGQESSDNQQDSDYGKQSRVYKNMGDAGVTKPVIGSHVDDINLQQTLVGNCASHPS